MKVPSDFQQQGSIGWHRDRLGCFTGSKMRNLFVSGRKKDEMFGATATSYIIEVMSERLLSPSVVADDNWFLDYVDLLFVNSRAVEWGKTKELEARERYEKLRGVIVHDVGFIKSAAHPTIGASPDGVITDEQDEIVGCIEIKCPLPATATKYMVQVHDGASLKEVNPDYYYQVQTEMMVTEADWCDFIVYCEFLERPLHVVRIERNIEDIAEMIDRVNMAELWIENVSNK